MQNRVHQSLEGYEENMANSLTLLNFFFNSVSENY